MQSSHDPSVRLLSGIKGWDRCVGDVMLEGLAPSTATLVVAYPSDDCDRLAETIVGGYVRKGTPVLYLSAWKSTCRILGAIKSMDTPVDETPEWTIGVRDKGSPPPLLIGSVVEEWEDIEKIALPHGNTSQAPWVIVIEGVERLRVCRTNEAGDRVDRINIEALAGVVRRLLGALSGKAPVAMILFAQSTEMMPVPFSPSFETSLNIHQAQGIFDLFVTQGKNATARASFVLGGGQHAAMREVPARRPYLANAARARCVQCGSTLRGEIRSEWGCVFCGGAPCVDSWKRNHGLTATCGCTSVAASSCRHPALAPSLSAPCSCPCHAKIEAVVAALEAYRENRIAFVVHDREFTGRSKVWFAPNTPAARDVVIEMAARARGAYDANDVHDTTGFDIERMEKWDRFALQGFVPMAECLSEGWWFGCEGCDRRVTEEDDAVVYEESSPDRFGRVYHNTICAARHAAEKLAQRWEDWREYNSAILRWPMAREIRVFGNDSGSVEVLFWNGKTRVETVGVLRCPRGHKMRPSYEFDATEASFVPILRCSDRVCQEKRPIALHELTEMELGDGLGAWDHRASRKALHATETTARAHAPEMGPCVLCGGQCAALRVFVHDGCVDDEVSAQALAASIRLQGAR